MPHNIAYLIKLSKFVRKTPLRARSAPIISTRNHGIHLCSTCLALMKLVISFHLKFRQIYCVLCQFLTLTLSFHFPNCTRDNLMTSLTKLRLSGSCKGVGSVLRQGRVRRHPVR